MNLLPLEIAQHIYTQWYSEIKLQNEENQLYLKYLQGKSIIQFKNGNLYTGELKAGLMNGKGFFKWKNGLTYEGEFQNNLMEGEGKLTWVDGSTYSGTMRKNKKHGQGTYYSKSDNSTYSGQWLNDERTGRGRIQFQNGSIYEGLFHKGNKQGSGKMTYPSGNYYEGQWKNNQKQGQGTMIWQNSSQKYIGQWFSNKQNGRGTHVWLDNKTDFKLFRNRYDGQWVDCRREGFGTFYYTNGTKFDGHWNNNVKQGFGIFTEQTGKIKIGFYKQDRFMKPNSDMSVSIMNESINFSMNNSIIDESHILNQSSIVNQTVISKQPEHKKLRPLKFASKKLHETKQSSIPINKQEQTCIYNKNQVAQNIYPKLIDIEGVHITESFRNYLLRQHSQTKQWYKLFTSSQGQFYSGMILSDFNRMLKQLKMINEVCNPAMINRVFSKGVKSFLDLKFNNKKLLQFIETHPQLHSIEHLDHVELAYHAQKLYEASSQQLTNLQLQNHPFNIQNLFLVPNRNIHQSSSAILFRHFVNLLLILAILKYPELQLQKATTKLFETIAGLGSNKKKNSSSLNLNSNYISSSSKLSFQNTSFRSGIPLIKVASQWTKPHNEKIFQKLTQSQKSLFGTIDKSVSVRTLLKLFERTEILKEPLQKLVFLQKVEKHFDRTNYYFTKEFKSKADYIISNLQKSQILVPILNYELSRGQFCDLFEMTMLKRISYSNRDPEQLKIKYTDAVSRMIAIVNERATNGQNRFKKKVILSAKQKMRDQKIAQAQAEKIRIQTEKKKREEEERQEMQRQNMALNDCNIPSDAYLDSEEDEFD